MPTQTKKASPNGKSSARPKRASSGSSSAGAKSSSQRSAATRALDLPVGAVLELSDRVSELVGPFTDRNTARKQLKSYRTRVNRSEVEQRVRKAVEEQASRAQGVVSQVGGQLSALR
ncbi:MAG TPA: hypothetical protein VFU04_04145 [Solirubrobacterales bacterium]|nr:hypothetical protein [Solirubrobacterales bacterium]